MSDIKKITRELGDSYRKWKFFEKDKDKCKKEFFSLVDAEIGILAERIVEIEAPSPEIAHELVTKRYPRWEIENWREVRTTEGTNEFEFIIKENPKFKTHSFINPEDQMVYTRQVQSGSAILDDERLQEVDPDLYEAVTYVPEPERRLKSLDDLTPSQLAKLQEFMYEGPPVVKLAAPRKAKPEELE